MTSTSSRPCFFYSANVLTSAVLVCLLCDNKDVRTCISVRGRLAITASAMAQLTLSQTGLISITMVVVCVRISTTVNGAHGSTPRRISSTMGRGVYSVVVVFVAVSICRQTNKNEHRERGTLFVIFVNSFQSLYTPADQSDPSALPKRTTSALNTDGRHSQ